MYNRNNNYLNTRVASPTEVVILLLVIALVCVIEIIFSQRGSLIMNKLNSSTQSI